RESTLLRPDDRLSFGFREAAPDAVRLVNGQCVLTAHLQYRAGVADGLGSRLPPRSCRSSFSIGMEKGTTVHSPTSPLQLPVPNIGVRARESARVCHS